MLSCTSTGSCAGVLVRTAAGRWEQLPMQAACKALKPGLVSRGTAPCRSSSCSMRTLPLTAASCSGVALVLLRALIMTPGCFRTSSAAPRAPSEQLLASQCRGVLPLLSAALTSAPAAKRAPAISTLPTSIALCSSVYVRFWCFGSVKLWFALWGGVPLSLSCTPLAFLAVMSFMKPSTGVDDILATTKNAARPTSASNQAAEPG